MCNTEDTPRIEIRQAEHAGDVAPAGAVTVDRALIREMNLTLREQGRKICNTCGVEQDLHADYQPDKRLQDGRAGRCRTCANKQLQTRRAAADGLEQALENGYYRAKGLDLPAHKIPRAELLVYWDDHGISPWKCYHTGVDLVRQPYQLNSRTIDHVQPLSDPGSAGHVLENLVPCSRDYNIHKSGGRAVEKHVNRPQDRFPTLHVYAGLGHGHAGVDNLGNPLAPAQVEWSDSDREPVVVTLDSEGEQVFE